MDRFTAAVALVVAGVGLGVICVSAQPLGAILSAADAEAAKKTPECDCSPCNCNPCKCGRPTPTTQFIERGSVEHVWYGDPAGAMVGVHFEPNGTVYADFRTDVTARKHIPDLAVIAERGASPRVQVTSPEGEVVTVDLYEAAKAVKALVKGGKDFASR